jgi:hypothetical protein
VLHFREKSISRVNQDPAKPNSRLHAETSIGDKPLKTKLRMDKEKKSWKSLFLDSDLNCSDFHISWVIWRNHKCRTLFSSQKIKIEAARNFWTLL